jgi:hypothetical protein
MYRFIPGEREIISEKKFGPKLAVVGAAAMGSFSASSEG